MKTYKEFFKVSQVEPEQNLFERIVSRIKLEEKFVYVKSKLIFFSCGVVASLVAFILSAISTHTEIIKSGFSNFFSLIFSDFQVVMANWQSFGISLIETLPIVNVVILLVTASIFILLLKVFSKSLKILVLYNKNAN